MTRPGSKVQTVHTCFKQDNVSMNGPWDRRRSAPRVRHSFLLICLYSWSRGNIQARIRGFFLLIGWLVAKRGTFSTQGFWFANAQLLNMFRNVCKEAPVLRSPIEGPGVPATCATTDPSLLQRSASLLRAMLAVNRPDCRRNGSVAIGVLEMINATLCKSVI